MERKVINYAHRGASAYYPENTEASFLAGIYMGADGLETDVQRAADGLLVLFHDDTLERVCPGAAGKISDYTYDELKVFDVRNGNMRGKITPLWDFLGRFGILDYMTLAIELKAPDCEGDVYELLLKYGCEKNAIITSFNFEYLKKMREVSKTVRLGYLTSRTDAALIGELSEISAYEVCPKAETLTPEIVKTWHAAGLNVRAWGVYDEELMKKAYEAGVDGMTVNFPDKLTAYIKEKQNESQGN